MILGDFNPDGVYDCDDINLLTGAIADGMHDPAFDMTGDGNVDLDDRDQWLAVAGAENLASENPYLLADLDLDGNVDGLDFIAWNANRFTDNTAYCSGDVNADGFVDGMDFIIWNQNKFQSADALGLVLPPGMHRPGVGAVVPEPSSFVMICAIAVFGWRRK